MKAIKNKDTKPEIILRKILWRMGYRYRKNYLYLPGKPDIVFVKAKVVIFIDGEFWHGYNWEENKKKIGTRKEFWIKKIEGNIGHDSEVNKILENLGWKVLRFWGNEILKNSHNCIMIVAENVVKNNYKN